MANKTGTSKKPKIKTKPKSTAGSGKSKAAPVKAEKKTGEKKEIKNKPAPAQGGAKAKSPTVKEKKGAIIAASNKTAKTGKDIKIATPSPAKKMDPDFFHDDEEKEEKTEVEFVEESEEIEFIDESSNLDDLHTLDDDEEEIFGGDDF